MRLSRLNFKKVFLISIILSLVLISAFLFAKPKQIIKTVYADGDLATMISSAGTSPITLKLTPGVYNISSDLTIPYNVTLNFQNGAVISIAGGATLSIRGPIDDCAYKIFDDQNADTNKGVKFYQDSVTQIRPEWWGAKADNNPSSATANANAINKAIFSYKAQDNSHDRGKVLLKVGTYYIDHTVTIKEVVDLVGEGNSSAAENAATLRLKDSSNCDMLNDVSNAGNWSIFNVRFEGGSQSSKTNGIKINGSSYARLQNCYFSGFTDYAINTDNFFQGLVQDNIIENSYNGMRLNQYGEGFATGNKITFSGDYGVWMNNLSHPFTDSDISGQGTGINCMYVDNLGAFIQNNHLHNCQYGIFYNGGGMLNIFSDNVIENNLKDGVLVAGRWNFNATMTRNTIRNNGGWGINLSQTSVAGGIVSGNNFSGNASGAIYYDVNNSIGSDPWNGHYYTLMEANEGVDSASSPAILESSSWPGVGKAKYWETNNSSPVTITDFNNAPIGKQINITFNDLNTTLKFSNSQGPELVQNGDFSSSNGWQTSPGWSYNGWTYDGANRVFHDDGHGGVLQQDIPGIIEGKYYEVSFTIKNFVQGQVTPYINSYYGEEQSGPRSYVYSGNGTYKFVVRAGGGHNNVGFRTSSIDYSNHFIGDIDNVSVKEVTSALKGFSGQDKKFNIGDSIKCTKEPTYYWHCE